MATGTPARADRGWIGPRGTSQASGRSSAPTKAPIVRWRLDPLLESRQRLGRQDGRLRSVVATSERLGTTLVVGFEQRPNAARRERYYLRDLINIISARQSHNA